MKQDRNFIDAWLCRRGETKEDGGLIHLVQSVQRGGLDEDSARALCEYSPRLVQMMIEGMYPAYGRLSFRQFIDYAKRGMITNGIIARSFQ